MSLDVWIGLVILFGVGGLTPGPAVLLVTASSFQYGFRSAMLPALGVASANVIWLVLAATGVSALITQSDTIFLAMKGLGFLVILYLGFSTIFGPLPDLGGKAQTVPARTKLFSKGVGLQLSSPMPVVFFGALLPAFFDTSSPMLPQFLIMLVTITATELIGLAVYAYSGGTIRRFLSDDRQARWFNIAVGVVMIGAGAWAILSNPAH